MLTLWPPQGGLKFILIHTVGHVNKSKFVVKIGLDDVLFLMIYAINYAVFLYFLMYFMYFVQKMTLF